MVPVEVQGASTRSRRARSLPPGHSAASVATSWACSESRARLSRSRAIRASERSTAVTCAPACDQLRRFAAGRGAEVGDRLALDVAEQPRRQRGGGVLHPPLPVGKARQHRHRPCNGVRTVPVGSVSPCSRLAHCGASDFTVRSSDGSWLMRNRHLLRGGLAVMRGPARHQPRRNIQRLRLDLVDQRLSLARAAAQHALTSPAYFAARRSDCTSRTDRSTAA